MQLWQLFQERHVETQINTITQKKESCAKAKTRGSINDGSKDDHSDDDDVLVGTSFVY